MTKKIKKNPKKTVNIPELQRVLQFDVIIPSTISEESLGTVSEKIISDVTLCLYKVVEQTTIDLEANFSFKQQLEEQVSIVLKKG